MDCDEGARLVAIDEEHQPASDPSPCWRRGYSFRLTVLAVTSAVLLVLAVAGPQMHGSLWELGEIRDVVSLADNGPPPNYRGGGLLDQKLAKKGADLGVCVGHVISAGAWTAAVALKAAGASVECDLGNYGPDPGDRQFRRIDRTLAEDPESLKLRGPLCARNVLAFIRDSATVGTLLEAAADFCSNHRIDNIPCASAVMNVVRQSAHFSRFASELALFCPEDSELRSFFLCGNRIEGLGWIIDALLGAISSAARTCGAKDVDFTPKPKVDYGSCVGEVLGSAGYIAASGFNTWNAANFGCLGALEPEEILKLTPTEKDRINARCAQLSASSARTFAIAAAKASEAAQHCSPNANVSKEARCGRTMSLGLAALAGAAEAAGRMRGECGSQRACCESRVGSPFEFDCDCTGDFFLEKAKSDKFREKRCARWASGMMKEISIVWTMMSEAAGECGDNDFASNACSHFLGGTFAGLFFFSEAISRMALRCKDTADRPIIYFACSQDQGFMGESIDTMAVAIGASLRDCGYGFGTVKRPQIRIPKRNFGEFAEVVKTSCEWATPKLSFEGAAIGMHDLNHAMAWSASEYPKMVDTEECNMGQPEWQPEGLSPYRDEVLHRVASTSVAQCIPTLVLGVSPTIVAAWKVYVMDHGVLEVPPTVAAAGFLEVQADAMHTYANQMVAWLLEVHVECGRQFLEVYLPPSWKVCLPW
ncbi:unnamed protein product [Symbiodinium sp. KB8]|nr:unnamed protein product [Symbiodinium sp. KB8]